jgi:anti-sigma28 factor (negative regulator of flagellin synthesis)
VAAGAPATSPQRLEALRRMVEAGQYEVNPRYLAAKIFHAAGVKVPE